MALIVGALPQVKPDDGPGRRDEGSADAIRIARCRLSLAARVPQFHRKQVVYGHASAIPATPPLSTADAENSWPAGYGR
ncbi:hypothetical protein GSF24_27535 [Microbispora triticiradicis]|nr:hypothetical protein [Microbispora triticiradicis]